MRSRAAFVALALALGLAAVGGLAPVRSAAAATARTTARSGNWSDPATWTGGAVPLAGDTVTVGSGHEVTYDLNAPTLGGMTVAAGATLRFAPDRSSTLQSTGNVVVDGTLSMRPANPAVNQVLRLTGVNPGAFVGGGMDPLATDVGLWVMGAGRLDVVGSAKTAWARVTGPIAAGATAFDLDAPATGWRPGDVVSVAPTEPPTVGSRFYSGFDTAAVTGASGSHVTIDRGLPTNHPMVNGQWTAEVMNLDRNVRIEGTPTGPSHVFIRSTAPQTVDYAAIRYMGPGALGRYGLHFHMGHDGSRGSSVTGTVVRDTNAHAYVAHMSDGITFKDTISYKTVDDAYWWDVGESTNDLVYDHAIAALVRAEPAHRGYRMAGFELGQGINVTIRNSAAVGVQGNRDASGFEWPEKSEGTWGFHENNITHNNKVDGIFNWQNTSREHVLSNFVSYHNGEAGVDHGAYNNAYKFSNATLYGNGRTALELRAVGTSTTKQLRFDNVTFDGGGISQDLVRSFDHQFDGTARPTIFANSTFKNAPRAFHFGPQGPPDAIDVIAPTITTPTDVAFDAGSPAGNVVRLQTAAGSAQRITPSGRTTIPPFADVNDTLPPTVSIIAPVGGALLSGIVPILVAATDNVGVTKIELIDNKGLIGTSTTAPFTFDYVTTSLVPGSPHRLQLRAYDAAGNTTVSTEVAVTIATAPPTSTTAPPTSTTAPPTSTTAPPTSTTAPPTSTTAPPTSTTTPPSSSPDVPLSTLTPTVATNGLGPFERDRHNGGAAANDGGPMVLNGVASPLGVGVNAISDLKYTFTAGQFTSFRANVGIDDSCGAGGSSVIEVRVNDTPVFVSPVLRATTPTFALNVNVAGKSSVRLIASGAGDGTACDRVDWAGARLVRAASATDSVSDLAPGTATNGAGPVETDRSTGGAAAGDGGPITLQGATSPKGIGMQAPGSITFALGRQYRSFVTNVGIDDDCGDSGSAVFEVYVNGVQAATSGLLRGSDATGTLTVDVTGKDELRLAVTDGGDGTACDHADWADARLVR